MDEMPSMNISTQDLQTATNYIDEIVQTVREAHSDGIHLDVESLALMMLMGIIQAGTMDKAIIVQQALMLSIAIQKLAFS